MTEAVLDASAVLALIQGEPGGAAVEARLDRAKLSAVNLAEVAQRLNDQWPDDMVATVLAKLPCEVVDFNAALALRAGLLRRLTRAKGLSLGDRACLALAERESAAVLTGDRAWAELDLGVEVVLIR
ncbi:type II toxin-antitoxin system VapC family toxin [Phenylobacterium sp.]|uniref:type II toxin-antitoxin system VapC family toxin n=1 Tax=Phenylobacterium sp. TaxID=1871053 RepID=UPI002BC94617|nr:type II toxin-antitoxin system VapC family toxin [Phenylobacterium sp.]HLZ75677.1 type II toxin-antitoxin system VapC family toxin [Phenylobacterium sp.]